MSKNSRLLGNDRQNSEAHTVKEGETKSVSLSNPDISYLRSEWGDDITVNTSSDGLTLTVTNQAGVIGLPSGDYLQIRPKVETNLLFLLAYSGEVNDKVVRDREPATIMPGESLPELLAQLLEAELEHVRRRGLDQEYKTEHGTEQYVRGQIQVQKQLQRQGSVPTQFECRYHDRTPDIPINQILLTAVERIVQLVSQSKTRAQLLRHRAQLRKNVSSSANPLGALENITLSRLNEHYRSALLLAETILDEDLLRETGGSTKPFPSMVFYMPDVFEQAVYRAFSTALSNTQYRVTPEDLGIFANRKDGEGSRNLKPDVVVRRETSSNAKDPVVAVIDAKWKTDEKPSSEDLYQIATYQAYADVPGMLIYPNSDTMEHSLTFSDSPGASNRGDLLIQTIDTKPTDNFDTFVSELVSGIEDSFKKFQIFD